MSAGTAGDRQNPAADIGSGFLWSTGSIALGAISWFGLHRAAPAILMIVVGVVIGALTAAVAQDSEVVLSSLLIVPALVGAGWLCIKLIAALWPLVLLAATAFVAVAASRYRAKAPTTLERGRRQLKHVYHSLTGSRTDFDDVLISRGLFLRSDDGTVQRPTAIELCSRNTVGTVRFRPLPGTVMAWEAAMGELPHLFGVDLLLSSPERGVLDLSHRQTETPPVGDPLHS